MNNNIFERNMLSLSLHNKELAVDLSASSSSNRIIIKNSRTQMPVPVLIDQEREYSLHSLFDPQKEGFRYSDSIKGGGYIVVFGFGAAYHISALLEREDVNGLLVIEKDISMLKTILSMVDLSTLLSDSRLSILVDKTDDFIREYLPSNYLPAVTGDFKTVSLRSRIESEREYFTSIFDTIKSVLNTLSDDYTVQTWFGKRWFKNSIANLEAAEKSVSVLSPQKDICIAAAGPSLEIHLEDIIKKQESSFLISTDTALSCLLKNNIKPDLVISIDCQQITYHHFMAGYPRDIPLVLDLASPPLLARLSDKTIFFTSGHPFSRYINRNWRKFPFVDTSGGNVTHAAISLADSLGAQNVYIYGADFSYPEGKSYARGTYIYPYFTSKSNRTSSIETNFFNFLYRNKNIKIVKTEYGHRYYTRPMLSYKERLELFVHDLDANIIPVKGLGETIIVPEYKLTKSQSTMFSAGRCRSDWKSFLSAYKEKLNNLSEPDSHPSQYLASLDYTDKDIWTTLFPIAAVLRNTYRDTEIKSIEILHEVRSWALGIIDLYLD